MVGLWLRPWQGEKLVGEILAVSGDFLVCRAPGGAEFFVELEDVRSGKCRTYRSQFGAICPTKSKPYRSSLAVN